MEKRVGVDWLEVGSSCGWPAGARPEKKKKSGDLFARKKTHMLNFGSLAKMVP